MKKIIAFALVLALQFSTTLPMLAIEEANVQPAKKHFWQKKNKETKEVKGAISHINYDWWQNFNDPNLSDYIARAIEANYDMKIATLSTQEFYQNYRMQFSNELPHAYMGFAPGMVKMPGSTKTVGSYALPFVVSYEADIFLKNRDKTKSVQKLYEASLQDERAAHIAVASAVGTVYFNAVMLDKAIELQEKIYKERTEIYELMNLSAKQGLVSTSDTIKANKALVMAQSDLIELKKQREKILNQLAVLIAESPENSANLKRTPLDDLIILNKLPETISSSIIENRPDYLRAEKMVEKAGIDVRVAKKEFLPSFNLGGIGAFTADRFGSVFSTKSMLVGLGASAIMPLFTGGQRLSNLRLKKTTYERVLNEYLKTNLTAIQEVNDSMVSAKLDWNKLEETIKSQNLEQKEYNYTKMKFNQGLVSKLDLIQHRENLLSINQLVAKQKIEYLVDYIGVYKACGAQI